MNVIQKALAYGTPGVVTLAGGFLYVQHEIHYWLTPAHMANVGLAAGVGGAVLCSYLGTKAAKAIGRKGKQEQELPAQEQPQALPQGQPIATDAQAYLTGMRDALLAKQAEPATPQRQVIDLGHA